MKEYATRKSLSWYIIVGLTLAALIAGCIGLNAQAFAAEEAEDDGLYDAYLYTLEDGMPKYWLDFTGAITDNLVLHCYFRSGDPTYYETFYILDLDTADIETYQISIHNVYDETGWDISDWFESITLSLVQDSIIMNVKRDEKTLAGGEDDNLLTGVYPMDPMGAGIVYEYYQEDGQLKYWLDLDGEDIELHGMFRSGDPEYYEDVYTLDMDTAEWDGDYTLVIHAIYNSAGIDVSDWFKSFTITEVQGALNMSVERDERTLAGGADDNILTGVYLMEPRTYLRALNNGPFTPEELCVLAQEYYDRNSGFYPPEAEYVENDDGTYTIHLFEIVDLGEGLTHTATSAWYTVDEYGIGTDDIYMEPVDLAG